MIDIVQDLRERAGKYDAYDWHSDVELRAADEIERLRNELEEANKMIHGLIYAGSLSEIRHKVTNG